MNMKTKTPLYNVLKDNKLVLKESTLAECSKFMADAIGDPTGIVLVSEAKKAGYSLIPLA